MRNSENLAILRVMNKTIMRKYPGKFKQYDKYRDDWWEERISARIRMQRLSTNNYRHRIYPDQHDGICRHCNLSEESETHWLNGQCIGLDYSNLETAYHLLHLPFPSSPSFNFCEAYKNLYESESKDKVLRDRQISLRTTISDHIILFCRDNKLFKRIELFEEDIDDFAYDLNVAKSNS